MAKWLNAALGGAYTLTATLDSVSVDPSTIGASLTVVAGVITFDDGGNLGAWEFTVTPTYLPIPSKFRVRSFVVDGDAVMSTTVSTNGVVAESIALTPVSPAVTPDPAEFTSSGRAVTVLMDNSADSLTELAYVVEYDAETADVFPIRGSLRTYRNATNPQTVFVRTEEGPMDLSAVATLEAVIVEGEWGWWGCWDYTGGAPWNWEIRIPAYSPEPGRVQFTIDRQQTCNRLWGPSHTIFVRADNRTIYSALLEVVG